MPRVLSGIVQGGTAPRETVPVNPFFPPPPPGSYASPPPPLSPTHSLGSEHLAERGRGSRTGCAARPVPPRRGRAEWEPSRPATARFPLCRDRSPAPGKIDPCLLIKKKKKKHVAVQIFHRGNNGINFLALGAKSFSSFAQALFSRWGWE